MSDKERARRKRAQLATATKGLVLLALILGIIRVAVQVLLTAGAL